MLHECQRVWKCCPVLLLSLILFEGSCLVWYGWKSNDVKQHFKAQFIPTVQFIMNLISRIDLNLKKIILWNEKMKNTSNRQQKNGNNTFMSLTALFAFHIMIALIVITYQRLGQSTGWLQPQKEISPTYRALSSSTFGHHEVIKLPFSPSSPCCQ